MRAVDKAEPVPGKLTQAMSKKAKEYGTYIAFAMLEKDKDVVYRIEFDRLLAETISLSDGIVSPSVLQSGEVTTQYTLKAEMATSYFTGVQIQSELTQAETGLIGGGLKVGNPMLEQRVYMLNQRAMALTTALAQFKTTILSDVLSCKIFTNRKTCF